MMISSNIHQSSVIRMRGSVQRSGMQENNIIDSAGQPKQSTPTSNLYLQLKSPQQPQHNTAQQHFNNRSFQRYSSNNSNNITNHHHSTNKSHLSQQSNFLQYRRQRSLFSPGIQRSFSQLDQFLKQTYQKYGIYQLVRQFVEMEDQLVKGYQYCRKLQRVRDGGNVNHNIDNKMMRVSCFEEINEVDELSLYAEQNVVHEFLYNLQQFFVPKVNLDNSNNNSKLLHQQQQYSDLISSQRQSCQQSPYEYKQQGRNNNQNIQNISNDNDNNNNMIVNNNNNSYLVTDKKKRRGCARIHTSRSKRIIQQHNNHTNLKNNNNIGLKDKYIFSDQKINKQLMTPLKFQQLYIASSSIILKNNNYSKHLSFAKAHQQPQSSIKRTQSEIIISQQQSSMYTDNNNTQQEQQYQQCVQQQQVNTEYLLRTIFQLRQEMLGLKQHKCNNNNNAHNNNNINNGCGFSSGQSSFYADSVVMNENILVMDNNNNNNNNHSSNTFNLDMLQSVRQQQQLLMGEQINKQNSNPNVMNGKNKLRLVDSNKQMGKNYSSIKHKTVTMQKKQKQMMIAQKHDSIIKTDSNLISSSAYNKLTSNNNQHQLLTTQQQQQINNTNKQSQSQTLSNMKKPDDIFIDKFFQDFKLFFRTEMEIQLILLNVIKKNKQIKLNVYHQYEKLIGWYSQFRINRGTRKENVERFVWRCLDFKGGILKVLKQGV